MIQLLILIVWIFILVKLVRKFGFEKTWGTITIVMLSLFLVFGLLSCLR